MSLSTIGALLPRDFLERQPKRWQKSQRKRRVTGILRKMKTKREKLEERAYKQRIRDDLGEIPKKPQRQVDDEDDDDAPAETLSTPAAACSCTPFGSFSEGLWAAHLPPNQVLLVKIPPGIQLCVLRASLTVGVAKVGAARSVIRCRTPAKKSPITLCCLESGSIETSSLGVKFSSADGACAIAAEGEAAVDLIGCYTREGAVPPAHVSASSAPRAAAAGTPGSEGKPVPKTSTDGATTANTLVEMEDGLKLVDTKVGKGRKAAVGNKLTVRYTGACANRSGKWSEFDSNKGKPFHFTLGDGDVIRGWEVGLVGMRVGGVRRLVVPPSLGYGDRGAGPVLPGATLVFEITLQNVV